MMRWTCSIIFLAVAGCTSPRESPPTMPENPGGPDATYEPIPEEELIFAEDRPWTEKFISRKALLADYITVEGPEGLVAHAVARADNDVHLRSVRTTKEGLLQEYRVRTDAVAAEHTSAIRGQLDGWQLMALRRLIILERPGLTEVRIRAQGDVFWRDPATGEEQRGDALEFVGEIGE